jgi:hypothetical protein
MWNNATTPTLVPAALFVDTGFRHWLSPVKRRGHTTEQLQQV